MVPPEVEHGMFPPLTFKFEAEKQVVTLDSIILPLSRHSSTQLLPTEEINSLLATKSSNELDKKALQGFIVAREKFLPTFKVTRILETVKMFESGGRGYMVKLPRYRCWLKLMEQFPNGWRWSCETTPKPPWCG